MDASSKRPGGDSGAAPELWTVDLGVAAGVDVLARLLAPDERERAARMRSERARRRFVRSRAALRVVLGGHLGERPERVELVVAEHGKPHVAGGSPAFNLSHTGDLAVIAVAPGHPMVGVDVERASREPRLELLAPRVLTAGERAVLDERPPGAARTAWFWRCWTAKEAAAKALGFGLRIRPERLALTPAGEDRGHVELLAAGDGPLPAGVPPIELRWLAPRDDHVAAVALDGAWAASLAPRELPLA